MNETTSKLLTLLNVSATRPGKRKWIFDDHTPSSRLNKRKTVRYAEDTGIAVSPNAGNVKEDSRKDVKSGDSNGIIRVEAKRKVEDDSENEDEETATGSYHLHFGVQPTFLSEKTIELINNGGLQTKREKGTIGVVVQYMPEGVELEGATVEASVADKILSRFRKEQEKLPKDLKILQDTLLAEMITYQDFYMPRTTYENHRQIMNTITLHALNHVMRKRRRILKNNGRIAHAAKEANSPAEVRDQGFTRPSVLVLLPFRSWALRWVESLISHTTEYKIDNHPRFLTEYGLPPGAEDKLEASPPGTYPPDHISMFKGNVDDSFRLGIKLTRKNVKLFADFYQCDLIIASPLGLRMSIEKEKNADFLSSIEVLIIDQMNALAMQNWEHLQFVISSLNGLPKETRDADFSRIKPWYLDGQATYLRQSILLSPFETPEFRHLFNSLLKNASGKKRIETHYPAIQVPDGISQTFVNFECNNLKEEADKRFQYFSTKLLPSVTKSALQSTNTVIFVPSSFDFIRVENHMRKIGLSFAVLSEYTSNQDISRARQSFFTGKKAFLLVSERFHFFRRYKLRGIRNILFYGLPDHSQFYTEFLSFPFLDDGVEGSDITCKALYCKYDWMKLERIAGTESASQLLK